MRQWSESLNMGVGARSSGRNSDLGEQTLVDKHLCATSLAQLRILDFVKLANAKKPWVCFTSFIVHPEYGVIVM